MGYSNVNVAADTLIARAKNTHYAVSTFAAVVYALVWLLSNGAHAESNALAALPEVFVTAKREVQPAITEVVVWGKREPAPVVAAVEEVVIYGTREKNSSGGAVVAANAGAGGGWIGKARHWLQSALLK